MNRSATYLNSHFWRDFLVALIFLCAGGGISAEEKKFCLVIPSYNNREWVEQNLDSVFQQKYRNYRVIYVCDGPTDGTERLVKEIVQARGFSDRVTILYGSEKQGPLSCMCAAAFSADPDEIILDLDGNDWLAHDEVLATLNRHYQDPNVWMTYGQFLRYPGYLTGFASEVPSQTIEANAFRSLGGAVTHLKTFYAGLFQRIEKDDFLWQGRFIQKAGDLAYIIPILEMAGSHIRFIPDVLYLYNYTAPIHEYKISDELEEKMDRYIRSKNKYLPVPSPYSKGDLLIYSQIEDLLHPTLNDYRFIQEFLSFGSRGKIDLLGDMAKRMRSLKIMGDKPEEFPKSGVIAVNCGLEEKENCLLVYSTFNDRYPKGLERLIRVVQASDFKGHILFRLGGWPDEEGGGIVLSHVPYAFKVSFFREARRLGYKRALWLDAAVVPLASLNDIFQMMKEKGCFVMGNGLNIGPYVNQTAAAYFGFNHASTQKIPSCSAGLFGVDFSTKLGNEIIDWWYRAALDPDAYYSRRSDQNALSMILYRLGVSDFIGLDRMPHHPSEIRPDSLFWLDREYVH